MALALSNLTSGSNTGAASTLTCTTASVTIGDGEIVIFKIASAVNTGVPTVNHPTATGLHFYLIKSQTYGSRRSIDTYRCFNSSGSSFSGTISCVIDAGANTAQEGMWSVDKVTGFDKTVTFGTAISASGTSGTASVSGLGTPAAGDYVYFAAAITTAGSTMTLGAELDTQLVQLGGGANVRRILTAYDSAPDSTPAPSCTFTSDDWGAIGFILKASTTSPDANWYNNMTADEWGTIPESQLGLSGVTVTDYADTFVNSGALVNPVGFGYAGGFKSGNSLSIWGGGHGDSSVNCQFILALNQNVPEWLRPRDNTTPSPDDVDQDGSGNPVSRHTYQAIVHLGASNNKLHSTGIAYAYHSGGLDVTCHTYDYDETSPNSVQPWSTLADCTYMADVAVYEASSNKVWSHGVTTADTIQIYDVTANTYSSGALKTDPATGVQPSGCIDEASGLVAIYADGTLSFYRTNNGTSNDWYVPSLTGVALPTASGSIWHDPVADKFVIWANSGKQIWYVTPPATSRYQGGNAWVVSTVTPSGGSTPSSAHSGGTYGRGCYIPSPQSGYLVVNSANEPVYFMRVAGITLSTSRPSAVTAGSWTDEAGGTLTVTDINDVSDSTGALDVAGASYPVLAFTADTPLTAASQTFYFRGKDIVAGKQARQVLYANDGTTVVATGAWHTMTGSLADYSDVLTPTATAYKGEIQTQAT